MSAVQEATARFHNTLRKAVNDGALESVQISAGDKTVEFTRENLNPLYWTQVLYVHRTATINGIPFACTAVDIKKAQLEPLKLVDDTGLPWNIHIRCGEKLAVDDRWFEVIEVKLKGIVSVRPCLMPDDDELDRWRQSSFDLDGDEEEEGEAWEDDE